MSCLIWVFIYRYGFRVFDIFSVIIQSYIEGFSFSNILDFMKFAFHSSKYMMKLLLQVAFWNILNFLLVWLLLKCSVFITCLQQSVLEFEKHGEHFPLVNLLVVSSFLCFSIVFPPINCFRFLFLPKANRSFFQIPF